MLRCALVRLQPGEFKAGAGGNFLPDCKRRDTGFDTAAARAAIDFDQAFYLDAMTLRGRGQSFDVGRVVDANQDARGLCEPRQAINFARIGHLVRHHDIVDAARNHDFGLGDLLTADAAGAAMFDLVVRDIHRLVCFGVRTMPHPRHL